MSNFKWHVQHFNTFTSPYIVFGKKVWKSPKSWGSWVLSIFRWKVWHFYAFTTPYIVFNEKSRIPEVNFFEYFSILKILFAKNTDTVGKLIKSKNLKKLFWEPITLAVMNTCVDKASAKILSNVLKKTVFSGSKKCNIYQPKNNWNKTLIEPALSYINLTIYATLLLQDDVYYLILQSIFLHFHHMPLKTYRKDYRVKMEYHLEQ